MSDPRKSLADVSYGDAHNAGPVTKEKPERPPDRTPPPAQSLWGEVGRIASSSLADDEPGIGTALHDESDPFAWDNESDPFAWDDNDD